MAKPEFEPVAPLIAVKSLEDEGEEENEREAGIVEECDEPEMCEVVATYPNSRFQEGQIVWVRAPAYHYAPRMEDGTLFVDEYSIIAIQPIS